MTMTQHQKKSEFGTAQPIRMKHTFLSKKILDSLNGKEVILAGDGRHDSMGHSAKYGTYPVFCCTVGLIIHIVLVQVA